MMDLENITEKAKLVGDCSLYALIGNFWYGVPGMMAGMATCVAIGLPLAVYGLVTNTDPGFVFPVFGGLTIGGYLIGSGIGIGLGIKEGINEHKKRKGIGGNEKSYFSVPDNFDCGG